jgi:predicted Zn-dependent protease with MMP-like domain
LNQDAEDNDMPDEGQQEAALWEALEALQELGEEDPEEALIMFATLPAEVQSLADFQLTRAALLRAAEQVPEARRILEALLDSDPADADAHHLLADVLEDQGELERATTHFLEVLRLDGIATADRPEDEVAEVLDETLVHLKRAVAELPDPWQARLTGVPLLVQRLPDEDMVRGGLDPRALGLFEGPTHAETHSPDAAPVPTRIVLFAENLALDFPDAEDFAEQVKITVLHELGHYFGLDEDDMVRLGLD